MHFFINKDKGLSGCLLFRNWFTYSLPSTFLSFSLIIILLLVTSCQKKYIGPELSNGTNFNQLQKMVLSSGAGVETHSFTYDANGKVISYNILLKGNNPNRTENTLSQYYRNALGSVDSIKIVSSLNGKVTLIKKIFIAYANNKIDYSIYWHNVNDPNAIKDSSEYRYNGNFLIERLDYLSIDANTWDTKIYRDLVFQYSKNNITNLIFQNTPTGGNPAQKQTKLISYDYDTSGAALPINSFQYGTDSVSFALQEYTATNNLVKIKYGEGASVPGAAYQYNYGMFGKPITGTLRQTNVEGTITEFKIEFFYD